MLNQVLTQRLTAGQRTAFTRMLADMERGTEPTEEEQAWVEYVLHAKSA